MHLRPLAPLGCLGLALLLGTAAARAAPSYRLTLIGLPPKVGQVQGGVANDAGVVAGSAFLNADPASVGLHLARWTAEGGLAIAGEGRTRGSAYSVGIDAAGRVYGTLVVRGRPDRVVLWDGAGGEAVVGQGIASGVNRAGDVAGFAAERPTLWQADGRVVPVDAAFHQGSTDLFVNAARTVAGTTTVGGRFRATVWSEAGGARVLVPPDGEDGAHTRASGIDDAGRVLGRLSHPVAAPAEVPFRWDAVAGYEWLPVLPGCSGPLPLAGGAEAGAAVVGGCTAVDPVPLPFGGAWIWTPRDGVRAVHALVERADPRRDRMVFDDARSLGTDGRIAGTGRYKGWSVVYLLAPLPAR